MIRIEQQGYRNGWVAITSIPDDRSDEDIRQMIEELLEFNSDLIDELSGSHFEFWQQCGGNAVNDVFDLNTRKPDSFDEHVMSFDELISRCRDILFLNVFDDE